VPYTPYTPQRLYARTTVRSERKLGSSTTVSRSDIRLIQYLDSSALGLVRRWLLIGYFPTHTYYPLHPHAAQLPPSALPAPPVPLPPRQRQLRARERGTHGRTRVDHVDVAEVVRHVHRGGVLVDGERRELICFIAVHLPSGQCVDVMARVLCPLLQTQPACSGQRAPDPAVVWDAVVPQRNSTSLSLSLSLSTDHQRRARPRVGMPPAAAT
jgi:hypothetical protein